MKNVREKKSAAEISAIRSAASKARKHFGGGRPKGSLTDPAKRKEPLRTIAVRKGDYDTLVRFSRVRGESISGAFHLIAESLRKTLKV